jgi:phosphoserine aminotransferase
MPVVTDMSSNILSEPMDVSKVDLIYAGAQKNMGPAGFAVVIIKDSLELKPLPCTPKVLDYGQMIKNDSMANTPSTYSIYLMGLVLDWLKSLGGLEAIGKINRDKAQLVYDFMDNSKFYQPHARPDARSIMNITFRCPNEDLDAKFAKEASALGLSNLKGHRSVGGIRASIYNAMPVEGVKKLVQFMGEFERNNK